MTGFQEYTSEGLLWNFDGDDVTLHIDVSDDGTIQDAYVYTDDCDKDNRLVLCGTYNRITGEQKEARFPTKAGLNPLFRNIEKRDIPRLLRTCAEYDCFWAMFYEQPGIEPETTEEKEKQAQLIRNIQNRYNLKLT